MKTVREKRAEFLINWFLDVYEGRKAPFPRQAFRGLASLMQDFMKNSSPEYKGAHLVRNKSKTPAEKALVRQQFKDLADQMQRPNQRIRKPRKPRK